MKHASPPLTNKPCKRRGKKILVACIIALLLITEIVLRAKWGFGSMNLFVADPEMEYLSAPNQDLHRLGNYIHVNRFSQRSRDPEPGDSLLVLLFGDSVANGGSQTDQDSLASTKLTQYLTKKLGKPVLVMNISEGSWGPDNCYAYLQKFGDFNAKEMVLLVSSHDAYDVIDHTPVVGIQKNYPAKQYPLALVEVVDRYLIPRYFEKNKEEENLMINKKKTDTPFNPGFEKLRQYASGHQLPFLVYLHAEQEEVTGKKYNRDGQEIIKWAGQHGVALIRDLDHQPALDLFRDQIHPNPKGQEFIFNVIKDSVAARLLPF